ncbi:hypothetical protein ADM99_08340 [Leptolinea tardivitalis]|uniref:Uncharacterized protein n=1 Tax=Leptolinea tardivitalis TaxID=229920 RepID=A0A0P6WSX1_9CHLR|nr:hypothetical protein ADM99_08340 [Leptolinea tardivitalis]
MITGRVLSLNALLEDITGIIPAIQRIDSTYLDIRFSSDSSLFTKNIYHDSAGQIFDRRCISFQNHRFFSMGRGL